MMTLTLPKDFREFIQFLNAREVKYLLIGGYAVAYHGHPRFTGDVDFLLEASVKNASRTCAAIDDFGLSSFGLKPSDFLEVGTVVQLGRPPRRIDLLTGVDGIDFSSAYAARVEALLDGLSVPMLSKHHLILSKRAAGRLKDRDDLLYLESDRD